LHDTNFDQLQSIGTGCCPILPLYGLVYLWKGEQIFPLANIPFYAQQIAKVFYSIYVGSQHIIPPIQGRI
jgi:hypothetical protein